MSYKPQLPPRSLEALQREWDRQELIASRLARIIVAGLVVWILWMAQEIAPFVL